MIYTNLDNFYVSKESLENSPSRGDGVPAETESELRIFGTTLIQAGGCLLQLPQVVMATGQVLFHRFFCKESMAKFDVEKVAWTSCWLATKLEETPRRMRDILAVFYRLQLRRKELPLELLDFYSDRYVEMKHDLVRIERLMLREFGFIVHVEHPHKLVLNHLQMMLDVHQDQELKNTLMQEAWNLTNDSLRTTLCVRLNSEVVACGIIFMAARRLKVPLPENPAWWELHNVAFEDIIEVCWEVQNLYQRPPAQYVAVTQGAQASSAVATPPASPLTGQGSPAYSLGPAAVATSRDAAAMDSRTDGQKALVQDAPTAPVPNGVDMDAAPSQKRVENGKRHRAERRRSKERERVRETGVSRERERASHRERDGREREARGRDRERDSRSERYDRDLDGRQDRERMHRDKLAERVRPDERAGRREGASDVQHSRRDVAEAGQKRSRAEDPSREQQEREGRKARVVGFSDRGRDRAERAPAHHDSHTREADRHFDTYRRANSSSSALHQQAERGLRASSKGNESRAAVDEERRVSTADRERPRPDRDAHSLQKKSKRPDRSMRAQRFPQQLGGCRLLSEPWLLAKRWLMGADRARTGVQRA
ncbi:g9719 [Coccomyxa elongata]